MKALAALRLAGGDVRQEGLSLSLTGPSVAVEAAKAERARIKREAQLMREFPGDAKFLLACTMLTLHTLASSADERLVKEHLELAPIWESMYVALEAGEFHRRRRRMYKRLAIPCMRVSLISKYGDAWEDTPLEGEELRDSLAAHLFGEVPRRFEL